MKFIIAFILISLAIGYIYYFYKCLSDDHENY